MNTPSDTAIPMGVRYRTLIQVEVLLYEYDALGVRTRLLPSGTLFQPWEPEPHWRGERVPITLGGDHAGFDWGVTSAEGHFLRWDDFFTRCAPEAVDGSPAPTPAASSAAAPPSGRALFARDARGWTPLFYAAERGDWAEVRRMIFSLTGTGLYPPRQALLEVRDTEGDTAADLAERRGYGKIADLLRGEWSRMEYFE